MIALGDADLQLALEGGEGFSPVAEGREAHQRFWSESSRSASVDVDRRALAQDTPVVVEHLRLISRVVNARR